LRIAKLSLRSPTFQQAIAASSEFIRHKAGDQIDGRHGFDLSLVQTQLEHSRDPFDRGWCIPFGMSS
jgi:hypothetical protein